MVSAAFHRVKTTRSLGQVGGDPEDPELHSERGVVAHQRRELEQDIVAQAVTRGEELLVGQVRALGERKGGRRDQPFAGVVECLWAPVAQGGELLVPQADGTADGLVRVGLELAVPDPRDDQDGDLASPVGELPAVAKGTAEGLQRAPSRGLSSIALKGPSRRPASSVSGNACGPRDRAPPAIAS